MNHAVSIGDDGRPPGSDDGPLLAALKTWFGEMRQQWRHEAEASALALKQALYAELPSAVPVLQSGTFPASGTLLLDLGGPQIGRKWLVRLLKVSPAVDVSVSGTAASSSLAAYGTAAAPGAGATVAAFGAAPPAGLYSFTVINHLYGTLAAGDNNNLQLVNVPGGPIRLVADAGTGTAISTATYQFVLNGSQVPAVQAVGAATAGSTYSAEMIATLVSSSTAGTVLQANWFTSQATPNALPSSAAWVWGQASVPAIDRFTSETILINPRDHLLCNISNGTPGSAYLAGAVILDYPQDSGILPARQAGMS